MVSQKSFTKIFLFSFSLRWSHKNIKPLSDGVVKSFISFSLRWSHKNIKPLSDGLYKAIDFFTL
ncbi:hypothetical protein VARV_GUI69_005_207 [Variola virus]|nr:hypothetical protein VARV_GUI69_005_207 [Variola virus]ABF26582.1 hypothetical protein VARV_NIG69_001_207 [Variola virus]